MISSSGKQSSIFLSETGSASGAAKSKKGTQGRFLDTSAPLRDEHRSCGQINHFRAQLPTVRRGHTADQRQRFGNYFDFFWRAKRPANVTVRLEYRQEKLRSFVQAREMSYPHAQGQQKTEFAIIGDDYLNDGRVISWRCLLIENGRIVAENRSYLVEMRAGLSS